MGNLVADWGFSLFWRLTECVSVFAMALKLKDPYKLFPPLKKISYNISNLYIVVGTPLNASSSGYSNSSLLAFRWSMFSLVVSSFLWLCHFPGWGSVLLDHRKLSCIDFSVFVTGSQSMLLWSLSMPLHCWLSALILSLQFCCCFSLYSGLWLREPYSQSLSVGKFLDGDKVC